MFLAMPTITSEKDLETTNDCLTILDNHVLPKYKNQVTTNVNYTKSECYGVLKSFFIAGKLNPSLTPQELEKIVLFFMSERLWVEPKEFDEAIVADQYNPYVWFIYPLKHQIADLAVLYFTVFRNFIGGVVRAISITSRLFITNLVRFYKINMFKLGVKK